MSARLVLIAATENSGGVGKDGCLPWHLPEDLKRLRALTLGGAVCYGRRTFESLPICGDGYAKLSERLNVLVTSTEAPPLFDPDGMICHSVRHALRRVTDLGYNQLFVLGGTRMWAEALDMAAEGVPTLIHMTHVIGNFNCDTFFPHYTTSWTAIQTGPSYVQGNVMATYQLYSNF